jgi:lipopolysaccharide transport system ATP-binding protein
VNAAGPAIDKPAAISVSGLGKTYRVWQHPSDMLLEALAFKRRHTEFQALADISFAVLPGSVTGIMGRNGAGKSTLLRIVAGTLDATAGTVEVNGRVSAILELGTGFSPEYTGRENIFLGGMCLGLKHSEIRKRFDEIIAFAEVGEFIDRPFRTFSSGMQARLTFAVATCVDPDILIIDEALAVGDARFQVKSFDRVREFKRRGKAILLVSHDMNQIASICDRAILLERGRVVADGVPQKVCNLYHEMLFSPTEVVLADRGNGAGEATPTVGDEMSGTSPPDDPTLRANEPEVAHAVNVTDGLLPQDSIAEGGVDTTAAASVPREHRYGDGAARIESIAITTPDGRSVHRLRSLGAYHLVCRIRAAKPVGPLVFGWLLRDKRGLDLFGWDIQTAGIEPIAVLQAGEAREVRVAFQANLGAGTYFITVALAGIDKHKHDTRFEALEIFVEGAPELYTTSIINLAPRLVEPSPQSAKIDGGTMTANGAGPAD